MMLREKQEKHLSIVFFDICNYSEMDVADQIECVEVLESFIREKVKQRQDLPIVEAGDSFAIGFNVHWDAVNFAVGLSKYLNISNVKFSIRIGIYSGEVVIRNSINDIPNIYGRGIDYAARLAACCNPGQILVATHNVDDVASRNSPVKKYINGSGKYKIKHGIVVDVYNLYSQNDGFGVPELPLKKKVDDSSLLIIVGDRRELPPTTAGDLFHLAPSIDDLCHIFKFDWPEDVLLRGDKIMCWDRDRIDESILKQRNLFVIGSPKVNIAALIINSNSIFRYRLGDIYVRDIKQFHERFSECPPNDESFIKWLKENATVELLKRYPSQLSLLDIEDPLQPERKWVKTQSETYGFISFSEHPFCKDRRMYSVFVTGNDLCATLTITGNFFKIDFTHHPLGGVIKVQKIRKKGWPWYEEPHHGEIDFKNKGYWETPDYDIDTLLLRLDTERKNFVKRISSSDFNLSMDKFQSLLRKQ